MRCAKWVLSQSLKYGAYLRAVWFREFLKRFDRFSLKNDLVRHTPALQFFKRCVRSRVTLNESLKFTRVYRILVLLDEFVV